MHTEHSHYSVFFSMHINTTCFNYHDKKTLHASKHSILHSVHSQKFLIFLSALVCVFLSELWNDELSGRKKRRDALSPDKKRRRPSVVSDIPLLLIPLLLFTLILLLSISTFNAFKKSQILVSRCVLLFQILINSCSLFKCP